MTLASEEIAGSNLQKNLSEWWSEEAEYVLQRIERWAAFSRGYNRLRSQRLSRGRLTMQESPESTWSISSNKLVIEDGSWNPRFHALKRSHRRRPRPEETKINCYGAGFGFNYQSNSNLDSDCLESYRYDHSIYFKTIGEIRSSKRMNNSSSDENKDERSDEDANNNPTFDDELTRQSIWPVVDLGKLDLNPAEPEVNERVAGNGNEDSSEEQGRHIHEENFGKELAMTFLDLRTTQERSLDEGDISWQMVPLNPARSVR